MNAPQLRVGYGVALYRRSAECSRALAAKRHIEYADQPAADTLSAPQPASRRLYGVAGTRPDDVCRAATGTATALRETAEG